MLLKLNKISKEAYNRYRNFVTNLIRSAKRKYYEEKFESCRGDAKSTWNLINYILRPSKKRSDSNLKSIIYDNRTYNDSTQIASVFNEHFSSVGQKISESIPSEENSNPLQFMARNSIQNSFVLGNVSNLDVRNAIRKLKDKSSPLDTYPTKIIKILEPILTPLLAVIVNKSINTSYFPNCLKTARVIPIYKNGDKKDVTNYRPISILPLFSKILERIVCNQLYSFLEKFNILHQNQYGFRSNRSTSQAILDYLQDVYSSTDKGEPVVSIFLDFSKAFDCIDHKILLDKLYRCGVRGCAHKWFASYLENRKQFVCVNDHYSETKINMYGVPQGSILGPLLFLLFINDFPNSNNFFKFTLFADDSNLLCKSKGRSLNEFYDDINSNLVPVYKWLISNKIKVNVDKCKYMVFSYRKQLQMQSLKFGTGYIEETPSIKFLGVTIDNNLTFKEHILHVKNKLAKKVGLLYRLNKFLPISVLRCIYSSIILPHFSYCILVWYSASAYLISKLFVVQKKCIRAICSLQYNESTNDHFKELNLLKLEDIYRSALLSHYFSTFKSNMNPNLRSALLSNSDYHNYSTRNRSNIAIPLFNRSQTQRCFLYRGVGEWNALPDSVKSLEYKRTFCKKIKERLMSQY